MQTPALGTPEFGAPCPILACPQTLKLLASRRSTAAQTLRPPGPDEQQLQTLLQLGARVPDHGKLHPWRFVIIEGRPKAELVDKLRLMAPTQPNPVKADAALVKLSEPPLSILVVSQPISGAIPVWEQELSAGAVCMSLLIAAQAMGFATNWITDWYAYDKAAAALFGITASERVAGFIHIGASAQPPLERERPDLGPIVSRLGA